MTKFLTTTILFAIWVLPAKAQTCGFGCLGMSGFYGGYTIQEFDAKGLNSIIINEFSTQPKTKEFGRAQGYRVGANIFRADFSGLFITAKGFYQFLNENHSYKSNNLTKDYKLKLNYGGLGLDFGVKLFRLLDFKLIEGGATIFISKLEISDKANPKGRQYETVKTDLSYYVGTGLIFHIIPNYISIEGTAFYSIFNIDDMEDANGNKLVVSDKSKTVIAGKKFGATVQLNLGLPL